MESNDKSLFDKIRERLGGKYQEGMLTYKEEKSPELDEEEVLGAIHTISVSTKVPEERIKEAIIELINKQIIHERFIDAIKELSKSAEILQNAALAASEVLTEINPTQNIKKNSQNSSSCGIGPCGEMILSSDAVEHLKQLLIVKSHCNVNGSNLYKIETQHEIANRNRHTSLHVPFYFSIVGQNRHVPQKDGKKYHTKFNRNVRPKGTHSHSKFYR